MNRKLLFRAALLATPLVALLLYAALNWYEWVEVPQRTGLGGEALKDPHLALKRLLARMGARADTATSPTQILGAPERGVLVLGGRRLVYMTPGRVQALDAWVKRGGILVVEAEPPGIDDPLLESYGIARDLPAERGRKGRREAGAQEGVKPAPAKGTVNIAPPTSIAQVRWPGAARPLRVRQLGTGLRLDAEGAPQEPITAVVGQRLVLVSFAIGQGRVVALNDFGFLRNRAIADHDHAEFAWRLVSNAPDARPAILFLRAQSPSLWDWMVEYAWPVLIAATVLLLAWLARIVPRFGPLEPEAPPIRRSLLEHLRAAGRFVWSRGEAAYLMDATRDRVWRTALRRRGGLKGLAHSKAQATLAEISGRPLATVHRAMHGADSSPAAFVTTAGALQEIESGMAHRSRTPTRGKKGKTP